jgi:hypothetical protein
VISLGPHTMTGGDWAFVASLQIELVLLAAFGLWFLVAFNSLLFIVLVAPERGVRREHGSETLFFCAAGCREQYEQEHPEEPDAIPPAGIVVSEQAR